MFVGDTSKVYSKLTFAARHRLSCGTAGLSRWKKRLGPGPREPAKLNYCFGF
jgi:hypothetical protein